MENRFIVNIYCYNWYVAVWIVAHSSNVVPWVAIKNLVSIPFNLAKAKLVLKMFWRMSTIKLERIAAATKAQCEFRSGHKQLRERMTWKDVI